MNPIFLSRKMGMEIDFPIKYNEMYLIKSERRTMEISKYVFLFEEADGSNKKLFGGKGAGLAEMTRMGLLSLLGLLSQPRPASNTMKTRKGSLKASWKK